MRKIRIMRCFFLQMFNARVLCNLFKLKASSSPNFSLFFNSEEKKMLFAQFMWGQCIAVLDEVGACTTTFGRHRCERTPALPCVRLCLHIPLLKLRMLIINVYLLMLLSKCQAYLSYQRVLRNLSE